MSAPTSGSADGTSIPGFYPDPSIPGYIRYWNGAAWVPGTSRPAPSMGEAMPAPPPGATYTQVTAPVPDETGPMYLDEEPPPSGDGGRAALPELRPRGEMDVRGEGRPDARSGQGPEPVAPGQGAGGAAPAAMDWNDPQRLHGIRPEPASAWQADASQQSGFGGEQDRRVAWGSDPAEAGAGIRGSAPSGPARSGGGVPDPRRAVSGPGGAGGPGGAAGAGGAEPSASAQALPPARRAPELPSAEPSEPGNTGAGGGDTAAPGGGRTTGGDGTISIRATRPGQAGPGAGGDRTAGPAGGQAPAATSAAPRRGDGTLTIRALGRGAQKQSGGAANPAQPGGQPGGTAPAQGAGALPPQGGVVLPGGGPAAPAGGAPAQGPGGMPGGGVPAQGGAPAARPQAQPQPQQQLQPQPQPQGHPHPQPGWQEQVRQLAQQPTPGAAPAYGAQGGAPGGAPEGVIPWKPPVDNPFQQAAQAQGRPAPLGRRLLARLIDSAVLLGAVGAAAYPLWTRASDHFDEKVERAKLTGETVTVYWLDGTTSVYLGVVLGLLLVVGLIYEALPTAKWGATPGKKLCGVRVLDIEGHDTPSFGAALRRWLVYGVLGLLVIGVFNVLWCLFDRPWRQCWHDKAARTFVAGRG